MVCVCVFSCVRLFATPWTVAGQAPLSMGFLRQEYWSGLPFPASGALPDPKIKPESLASPALAGEFFPIALPGKPIKKGMMIVCKMYLAQFYAYNSSSPSRLSYDLRVTERGLLLV